jgi:hypothetical protein
MAANGITFTSKRHEYAACSQPVLGWTEGQPQE